MVNLDVLKDFEKLNQFFNIFGVGDGTIPVIPEPDYDVDEPMDQVGKNWTEFWYNSIL